MPRSMATEMVGGAPPDTEALHCAGEQRQHRNHDERDCCLAAACTQSPALGLTVPDGLERQRSGGPRDFGCERAEGRVITPEPGPPRRLA